MDNLTQTTPAAAGNVPPPDLTGRTLGDFAVLRRLGSGGMGQVYLAEQISLKRRVALKILRQDVASNATSLQRFQAEAITVAQATHANIVQVYAVGEVAGLHFMALEYIDGWNLRNYLDKKGPPEVLLALSIMRQAVQALQRAAELGIIHRDIKPENILLTRKGEVKVADFGLSRFLTNEQQQPLSLTQSGVTLGTPLYMSPEQVEGRTLDSRTDIYSLGVTCYHMLAGHPPFQGQTAFEVALMHVRSDPQPLSEIRPDLPEGLCAIIHKMMAKDPGQRYQTGRELLKDLARVREGLSGQTVAITALTPAMDPLPGGDAEATAPVGRGSGSLTSSGVKRSGVATMPIERPRKGIWLLAGLSVVGALAAGVGLALADARGFGPAAWLGRQPTAMPTAPQDAALVEAVLSPQASPKREESLRFLVDQNLNAHAPQDNAAIAFGLCLQLGLFYLEQERLDDAEKYFTRLENFQRADGWKPYLALGRMGRGIVLALQNEPEQSNKLFQEAVNLPELRDPPRGPPGRRPGIEAQMWANPKFRFWLAQALYYNSKNGVEPPPPLQRMKDPALPWRPPGGQP